MATTIFQVFVSEAETGSGGSFDAVSRRAAAAI